MISSTNDDFEWLLLFNPTVAGTFTYVDETLSSLQAARGATANTVTGGIRVDNGESKSNTNISSNLNNALELGASIAGVRDEYVLCVRAFSNNAIIHGSITWRELL